MRIGQLDPFEGIGVDNEIPFFHIGGSNTGQQCKVARDHQPFNVVCVCVAASGSDGLTQAIHICLARPVEIRQGAIRTEVIGLSIGRHVRPVDTADVLAPAQNLPDKALD